MPVIWREQMTTCNDLVDQDHRYLLALFNSIELALAHSASLQHLPVFFRQLLDYTRVHFAREEQLQLKVHYPRYMEHKLRHQEITAQLEALDARIVAALGPPADSLVDAPGDSLADKPADAPADSLEDPPAESPVDLPADPSTRAETTADVPESDAPADQPDNEALRASLEREVLSFAREWVVDHIVKADLDLKPYLREYPRNFV